jgi:hypothetical protein
MSIRKITVLLSCVALAVAHGCSGEVKRGDSESHFIHCTEDSKCRVLGAAFSCVEGLCREGTGIDAGGGGNSIGGAAPASIGRVMGSTDAQVDVLTVPPDNCAHATYPARAGSQTGGDGEIVAVQYDVDLGDSPSNISVTPTRYRNIGFDLDNLCSTTGLETTCRLPSDSAGVVDGPRGIDNALGQLFQITRDTIQQYSSESYARHLQAGAANMIIHVTGYNGQPNDDQVRVEVFTAAPFAAFQKPGTLPNWDGNDVWPIDVSSVINADVTRPKAFDTNGYVSGSRLVATFTSAQLRLLMELSDNSTVDLTAQLRAAYVVCTITSTDAGKWGFTLSQCTLAGRWLADDLVKQLAQFPDPLDLSNPRPMCANSTSYPIFKGAICALRDVATEFAGPTAPCDGLSFGMNFDTRPAALGDVFANQISRPMCPLGQDPALDSCDAPQPPDECTTSNDCPSEKPICNAAGSPKACVVSLASLHCTFISAPLCDPRTHTCVAALADAGPDH